jgi:hypothetical protein
MTVLWVQSVRGYKLLIDQTNHRIYIVYRTHNICNAPPAVIDFLNSTPVAKLSRTSNPIQRIMAVNSAVVA